MTAPQQGTPIRLSCKVECQKNQYSVDGTFQCSLFSPFDVHELDQIESEIEKIGQAFKRQLTQQILETADHRIAEVAQTANPGFHKHGTRPFTIVARYGEVTFRRQRLFDSKKEETLIPSAIAWKTGRRRHLTAGLVDAACKESQQVSYRKASQNLADTSGQESLIAASTVWNKKQQRGQELKTQQKQVADKILKRHEAVLVEHNLVPPLAAPSPEEVQWLSLTPQEEEDVEELFDFFTRQKQELSEDVLTPSTESDRDLAPENPVPEKSDDVILVQLDEVVTKSQEEGRKTNLTYTGTVEDRSGRVVYLVAESPEALICLIAVQLVLFGLLTGKRLEVLGDGARWIAAWATGIVGRDVVTILCWYHLCKRVYEGLSGLGVSKERRKKWEREILGHLWRGEHSRAIWILWGLRSSAAVPKRLDDLIGYLLRKKRQLANYEERHARGEWIASTRVEKWNDVAVSERCKHRGMSWTESGVLAVAAYAENLKKNRPPQHTNS